MDQIVNLYLPASFAEMPLAIVTWQTIVMELMEDALKVFILIFFLHSISFSFFLVLF